MPIFLSGVSKRKEDSTNSPPTVVEEVIPGYILRFAGGERRSGSLENDGHRAPRRQERLHLDLGLRAADLRDGGLPRVRGPVEDLDHRLAIGRPAEGVPFINHTFLKQQRDRRAYVRR